MKNIPPRDFEKAFRETRNPIVLDSTALDEFYDGDLTTTLVSEIFFNADETEKLEIVECECGTSHPNYSIGTACTFCGKEVKMAMDVIGHHKSWVQLPDQLPPVIHPAIYRILASWMRTCTVGALGRARGRKVDLLELLLTPNSNEFLPEELKDIQTGMWAFEEHFDEIVERLSSTYPKTALYRGVRKRTINQSTANVLEYIKLYRHMVFVRHIPLVDPRQHLIQKVGSKTRTDTAAKGISAFIQGVDTLYRRSKNGARNACIEQGILELNKLLVLYSEELLQAKQFRKTGFIRKYIIGTRAHFTSRMLIVPITDICDLDEIYLPWKCGVLGYKLELLNLLINRMGNTLKDAYRKWQLAETSYDPEIDHCFKLLIKECPYKGLPVLIDRNPSLNGIF